MPIYWMIDWLDCGGLGYVLGYLRHGSFGRAARDDPADRGAWPPVRWRGLPGVLSPCVGGALYGLDVTAAAS